MIYIIVVAVILAIIFLTVLPGWLRKRRLGEDYEINNDPAGSSRDRKQTIRDWDQLDHAQQPRGPRL